MRHLKTYQIFEASMTAGLTNKQEEFLNKNRRGSWTYDPITDLVNVEGGFDISYQGIKDFMGINFGQVSSIFNCANNSLTSLAGAPQEIAHSFFCHENKKMKSLRGAPQKVGENFSCFASSLVTLIGGPQEVSGDFNCHNNFLTSLEGAPQKVGKDFNCDRNLLTSLAGAPQKVGGHFNCKFNKLNSLEGAPREVVGDFDCDGIRELTSLKGAPEKIGGKFSCYYFELDAGLWNLEGWTSILVEGSPRAQELILTLFSVEDLNQEIQKDPGGMIIRLKSILKDPSFNKITSKLVWPSGYEDKVDLVGDLADIGF